MRLIQGEQSVVSKISLQLVARKVCADSMANAKTRHFNPKFSVKSIAPRATQPCSLFQNQPCLERTMLKSGLPLRESGFTGKQKPTPSFAAAGLLNGNLRFQ